MLGNLCREIRILKWAPIVQLLYYEGPHRWVMLCIGWNDHCQYVRCQLVSNLSSKLPKIMKYNTYLISCSSSCVRWKFGFLIGHVTMWSVFVVELTNCMVDLLFSLCLLALSQAWDRGVAATPFDTSAPCLSTMFSVTCNICEGPN